MSRVLTCLDDPPVEGACTAQAWVEQPSSVWPALTVEEGTQIGQAILVALLSVLAVKLFLKPSTHRRS